MSDPNLPHGQLPPIPDGCGILPIAENRISHGPHPELLDAVPEGYASLGSPSDDAPLNDALEQTYRRVLSRALALAACALLLIAAIAASRIPTIAETSVTDTAHSLVTAQLVFRVVLLLQILFTTFASRYVEKLPIALASVCLFAYAAFYALEFSTLLPPAPLAVAFLCAGLMYAATALWGFVRRADLARPVTAVFMILAGGLFLVAVNRLLHTTNFSWTLSSLAVVVFAGLTSWHAQQIRDFYQDFDDDNAQGWKASVLGALLLLVNSVNLYLLVATFIPRALGDARESSSKLRL